MKLGILGAGHIGLGLATLGVRAGHAVMISNSGHPDTLAGAAAALGCAAGTAEQAARFGEVACIAVPLKNYLSIQPEPLAGKVVIDANNYYPGRDGAIRELYDNLTTTSELLARHLPHSIVVKAVNAILAADLVKDARARGSPGRRALPIAGDDPDAKTLVAALLDGFGYDVVDAGGLAESWRFERAKPGYCIPLDAAGMTRALAAAKRDVELPHGSWRK